MNLREFFTPQTIAANWTEVQSNRIPYLGEMLFPARKKAGLDLKWLKGSKGLPISLMPSAFDAKATFRDRIGFQKLETEMPFFREGFKIKERDRQELLRIQDSNDPYADEIIARVYDDANALIEGANVVPERMIMQLLFPINGAAGISIKANGVMVPGLARPEKDGNGYEIVAGHRRHHGCELAGLEEMPFIVREMTDHEAVQAMKDSNKQRDQTLPSELAALLELEVEDIKHQGGRLKNVAEGDIGKRSVEIVGEAHDMNYKKVMRYLRLNSLVPELLDKVDDKKMGFMPAVEISYIRPKNQRLIAVSIDGEQASPSLAQAKKLRELDKDGKLNGDVIDGILSEKKKEDRGVIISTAELEKYFGKEATPAKMKEQIMTLLDEWKEKQPPELAKAPKKMEQDK